MTKFIFMLERKEYKEVEIEGEFRKNRLFPCEVGICYNDSDLRPHLKDGWDLMYMGVRCKNPDDLEDFLNKKEEYSDDYSVWWLPSSPEKAGKYGRDR